MEAKPITPAQLKKIQTMFTKLGFEKEDKVAMIEHLTNGRATSTKDISFDEAKYLINFLIGQTEPDKSQRKKDNQDAAKSEVKAIYRLANEIGMCYGDTTEDKLMNCAKINKFCRERGTVKKNISEMTLAELKKTHKQFEAMLRNHLESSVNKLIKQSLTPKIIIQ